MKKPTLSHWLPRLMGVCLLLSGSNMSFAQDPKTDTTYQALFRTRFQQQMIDLNGRLAQPESIMGPNPEDEGDNDQEQRQLLDLKDKLYPYGNVDLLRRADEMRAAKITSGTSCANLVSWKLEGPVGDPEPAYNTPSSIFYNANKNARLDCITFDPSDPNTLYVGSGAGGGLWKVNGSAGTAVSMNTDKISHHNGVGAVAVIPNRVIVATGHHYLQVFWDRWEFSCSGIFYTNNQGSTWQKATVTDKNGQDPFGYGGGNLRWVSKIVANPSNPNVLFFTMFSVNVIYDSDEKNFGGLFKSTDGGLTWTEVNSSTLANRYFMDITFHPSNSNIIYLSSQKLYKSTDGGTTWADITNKLNNVPARPTGDQYLWSWYRLLLAVPPKGCAAADADHVGVLLTSYPGSMTQPFYIYHSADALATNVSNIISAAEASKPSIVIPFHYGFSMGVNPNTIYVGGNVFQRSEDGGASFTTNNPYWGFIHPDCQQIGIPPYNGSNGNTVYLCHDGGLVRSYDKGVTFTYINKNFSLNQFYGLGVSQSDNTIIAGAQDNFNLRRQPDGTWKALGVGDGNRYCAIDPQDPALYAFSDPQSNAGVSYLTRDPSGNIYSAYLSTTSGYNNRPYLYQHNEPNTLLAATDRFYRVANNVTTTGNTFKSSLPAADQSKWTADNVASCFSYCYSQPNVIYLATTGQWKDNQGHLAGVDPNVNYSDPLGKFVYNFFKSTDGGLTWQLLSTNLAGVTGRIMSVAVHPTDPNRVWITWSGYGDNSYANQNVFATTNGGSSWTNYSTGLPLGSTKKILYNLGGVNDELFVCLESGVYHRNSTMSQWECYSDGLPYTNYTDIDLNYCEGKLYASTYGRGVWSTDILTEQGGTNDPIVGDILPGESDLIATNTTWSSNHIVYGSVRVKSGATLTINNTGSVQTIVNMPKNGAIIVEPGAKIVVDGAKITNGCSGFWKGILVLGNPGKNQVPAYQGTAMIQNGAVLENARVAVVNWGESLDNQPWWVSSGGIIKASNSTFLNCARGAAFGPYHNYFGSNTSTKINNVSGFVSCTFLVDDNFRGENNSESFQAGITMSDVEGVSITGCNFTNSSTKTKTSSSGSAIVSWNASYSVQPYCTSTQPYITPCPTAYQVRTRITGFNIGISANGNNQTQFNSITVDFADFDKNGLGVYANYAQNLKVFNSTFNIGNAAKTYLPNCYCQRGIYAQNSHLFRIEENTFTDIPHSPVYKTSGVYIEESGAYNNDVYRNTFNGLYYGCYAIGNNAKITNNITTSVGLQFLCNTHNNNKIDVVVASDPSAGWMNVSGIKTYQGSALTPAGNVFNNNLGQAEYDNNTNKPIYYYYNGTNSGINPNSFTMAAPQVVMHPVYTANQTGCASRYYNNGPTKGPGPIKADFFALRNSWQVNISYLNSRIDNGNTADLLQVVENTDNSDELYNQLNQYSPYLSEDVLRSVGISNKLPVDQYVGLISLNPDVIKSPAFMDFLQSDQLPNPLSDDMINTLKDKEGVVTERTNMEGKIAEIYGLMISKGNDALDAIKTDSLLNSDSLANWYLTLPDMWHRYNAAWVYLSQNNYDRVSQVLEAIPTEFILSEADIKEYNSYRSLFSILQNVMSDGRSELDLNTDELNNVKQIADAHNGDASIAALTVYQKINGLSRFTCSDLEDGTGYNGQRKTNNNAQNPVKNTVTNRVNAFPNPANDYVYFSYDILSSQGNVKLTITDIKGSKVFGTILNGKTGQFKWDTRQLAPGTYLYRVADSKKAIQTGKVVIIK